VLLPGGHENAWEVNIDGELKSFRPQEGERFVPFDSNLPRQVEIKGTGSSLKRTLWEDERNNRLIIFSHPSGRFYQSTSLAEKEIALNPGRYILLLRFKPDRVEESVESLSEDPSLYLMELQLQPGERKCLCRGPAELFLQADNVATLNWLGESIRGLRGTEVYPSMELKLEILLPEEMLSVQGVEYEVAIKPGSLRNDRDVQIRPDAGGKASLDLEAIASQWNPGVSRLLAELRRRGSRRALARSSILLWNGLDRLGRSVFHCQRLPENLLEKFCENVQVKKNEKRITYGDDIHRFFKMVFEDGGRQHSFTWAVPGVFLSVEDHGEGSAERTIKAGSVLAVNSSSRSVLIVYCTDPAILELGEFRVKTDFSRVGSKRLPLSNLLEYVGPERNTLTLTYQGSAVPIRLVDLVSPHAVTSFAEVSHLESHDIHLKLQAPIEAISVSAEDIISGEKSIVEFELGDIEQHISRETSIGGRITVLYGGENGYTIYFALNGLMPSFRVLDFQVKIGGRWGALTDLNGNTYSSHILISDVGRIGVFSDLYYGQMEVLNTPEFEAMLFRVHKRLLVRHALECSTLVSHLIKTWNKLFPKLQDHSSIDYFFSLLVERSPQMVASTWIPSQNLGASFPQLFCYPKEKYTAVKKQRNSMLVNCLRLFPKLQDLVSVFSSNTMDTAVAVAFANIAQVTAGIASPNGFDLKRYHQSLRELDLPERWSSLNDDDWRPGIGDYLGPMHYRYAIRQMRENYTQTLVENGQKRGKVLALLKRVRTFTLCRFASIPLTFHDTIDLGLFETDDMSCRIMSEYEELRQEDLQEMVRFLSLFAQVCRCEARYPETLNRFFYVLKEKMDFAHRSEREKDLKSILSYLLYLGEDLFAFYLLLWELVFTADMEL
jgi:hypothetical protein